VKTNHLATLEQGSRKMVLRFDVDFHIAEGLNVDNIANIGLSSRIRIRVT
jgi:hypothetical protein